MAATLPQQPPYALVARGATEHVGMLRLLQRDERWWLELLPSDFDKPFFLSARLSQGIGEADLYGGRMLPVPSVVMFRRFQNQVQLVATNTMQTARSGTPELRALEASTSPSLLASVPIASQPHPQRQAVLIDAGAIFGADMLGLAGVLQRAWRQPYGFDARNSGIVSERARPEMLVNETQAHFGTAAIAVPNPAAPPGTPQPTVPRSVPDPRSLLLGVTWSLMRFPDQPMAPRRADARIGHFVASHDDLTSDTPRSSRVRWVQRWRLEKKTPGDALSQPVQPITYVMDRSIPLKYRDAIRDGILAWNEAFERIGFKDAIVVRQQPHDGPSTTLEPGQAAVRWLITRESWFDAIGPTQVDPRSGEILGADIAIQQARLRDYRDHRARILPASIGTLPPDVHGHAHADGSVCLQPEEAGRQIDLAALVAAGEGQTQGSTEWADLDPAGPEADAFVQAFLRATAMHEAGHTLGLRHNFRGSLLQAQAERDDPRGLKGQPTSASVMDYLPVALARPGAPPVPAFATRLGPYDYWAIEYAYRPFAPDEEAAGLARIAARSTEPALDFGSDEDVAAWDADSIPWDLGEPVSFAEQRLELAARIVRRQSIRTLPTDQDWSVLRRALTVAYGEAGRATNVLLRQVGGLRTLRDHAGSGRDPLQPVPLARQQAALDLLLQRVLDARAIEPDAALQRRLAADPFLRDEGWQPTEANPLPALLALQRNVLNRLMGEDFARRLDDNRARTPAGQPQLALGQVWQQLGQSIWREAATPGTDAGWLRRELQRDHVSRLVALQVRPAASVRGSMREANTQQIRWLLPRLEQAARQAPAAQRDHYAQAAQMLREAMSAAVLKPMP